MAIHTNEECTLALTGDSILTRELHPYEGNSKQFDRMLEHLRSADATMTNLEVMVHDYESYPAAASGGTFMRAPPAVLDELSGMGVDLFSAATNHTFDFTHGAIETTLDELDERGLAVAGLGRNLYEARRPTYVETPGGRVAMVSCCTSITPGSEAGEQSPALGGRPGLSPLHVEQVYRVPEQHLDDLRTVSDVAGIEAIKESWLDRGIYYNHDWTDEEYFHFGDMKFLPAEDESSAGVTYEVDGEDRDEILGWVEEAEKNADTVLMSVHSHQGYEGLQTTMETPDFLVEFAHDCVDAGADAFVSHGPHVLRGVEVYDGAPVFYSLGNFIVQNETVSRLPPESFRRYGLDGQTKVSEVFDARLYDSDGSPKGDLANEAFWQTVLPVCTFDGGTLERVELHPCTLQRTQPRSQRGVPVLARGEEAGTILDQLASLSERFDTSITRSGDAGVVEV